MEASAQLLGPQGPRGPPRVARAGRGPGAHASPAQARDAAARSRRRSRRRCRPAERTRAARTLSAELRGGTPPGAGSGAGRAAVRCPSTQGRSLRLSPPAAPPPAAVRRKKRASLPFPGLLGSCRPQAPSSRPFSLLHLFPLGLCASPPPTLWPLIHSVRSLPFPPFRSGPLPRASLHGPRCSLGVLSTFMEV